MNVLRSLSAPLREALALYQLLRRLGFPAEAIYLETVADPILDMAMVLRHQGHEFRALLGAQGAPADQVAAEWHAACDAWNHTASHSERMALFRGAEVCGNAASLHLLAALERKGFTLPSWARLPESLREAIERLPEAPC
jgi:hypothetical protein